MNIQQALSNITKNIHLTQDQMQDVMRAIMSGEATDAQIGALLMGLRLKGESIDEITAAARVMRELATKIDVSDIPYLVDIVGTGGDGQNLFNVSTASAFVIAAAGATIAKHGNRGVSTKSGSSDLLEQAGINLDLNMQQTERCIRDVGVGFLFAPNHHQAMKYAIGPRKELGIRSIFNLLGPLTNPAGAPNILMGVFHPDLVGIQARVLQQLGAQRALVVWGRDGMDEISLGASTYVGELRDGRVTEYDIHPEDFGIAMSASRNLAVDGPAQSIAMLRGVLDNQPGPANDIVALNAGAALYVAGVADSIADGLARARAVIADGSARAGMEHFVTTTRSLAGLA